MTQLVSRIKTFVYPCIFCIVSFIECFASDKSTPVKSWIEIRDAGIVKQNFDYSCGAASLATLLSILSTQNNTSLASAYTEAQILKLIERNDASSFADLKRVAALLGFKAVGYKVTMKQLDALKVPVIVYLEHFKNPHFSVLKHTRKDYIYLADPAWGNLKFTRMQFFKKWAKVDKKYGWILALTRFN